MNEHIERSKAIALIEQKQKELCPAGLYGRSSLYGSDREAFDRWEEIIDALESIPAADVVPIRYGRWIVPRRTIYGCPQYVCSACKKDPYWKKCFCHGDEKYCPNCGAKMNGGIS